MKKIMIFSNHHAYTYNFRKEVIKGLLDKGHEVVLVLPYGEKVDLLIDMGCKFIDLDLDRHGKNPLHELSLLRNYYKLIKQNKPDVILTYTIKPNLYVGCICRILKIKHMPNITGLGSAFQRESGILTSIIEKLYNFSLKNAHRIFFQNTSNLERFSKMKLSPSRFILLPGSGVNIEEFEFTEYNQNDVLSFIYIGRIMEDKGIIELIDAFKKMNNPTISLNLIGFIDDKNIEKILLEGSLNDYGINYLGYVDGISQEIMKSDAVINPSYHEGMSNVLLESGAMGRPLLASNIPGCQEIIEEGSNGFLFEPKSVDSIISAVQSFIALDYITRSKLAYRSREIMVNKFDRNIVVDKYLKEIEDI